MRTTPERSKIRYSWITLQESAERLGAVTPEDVQALGRAGDFKVEDLRGAGQCGIYRVDPASIDPLLARRLLSNDARRPGN